MNYQNRTNTPTPTAQEQPGTERGQVLTMQNQEQPTVPHAEVPRPHARLPKMPTKRELVHKVVNDGLLKSLLDTMEATDCLRCSRAISKDKRNGWVRFYNALHDKRDGVLRGFDPKTRITEGSKPESRQKNKAIEYLEECAKVKNPAREQVKRAADLLDDWKTFLKEQAEEREEEERLQADLAAVEGEMGLTPGQQLAGQASTNTGLTRTPPISTQTNRARVVVTAGRDDTRGADDIVAQHPQRSGGGTAFTDNSGLKLDYREFLSGAINQLDRRFERYEQGVGTQPGGGGESRKRRIEELFDAEKRAQSLGNTEREVQFRRQREDLENGLLDTNGLV